MNYRSLFATAKSWVILTGCCALAGMARGQSGPAAPAQVAATKQLAFANSKALFQSANLDLAEATLVAANQRPPGTAQWNAESGFSLTRMAFELHGSGNGPLAVAVAQRALRQLASATQKYTTADNPAKVANVYEGIGFIDEQLLGDFAGAEQNYAAAVRLSPGTGQAARLLARLRQTATEEAKRNGK